MKLLSIQRARALWMFHINDLSPSGSAAIRDVVTSAISRYSFNKPTHGPQQLGPSQIVSGHLFVAGLFNAPAGNRIEVTLTYTSDALAADTRTSTSDSDDFLENFLSWTKEEFGWLDHSSITIRKIYVSELYVSLDRSLGRINPGIQRLNNLLAEKIKTPLTQANFDFGALAFWIDPEQKSRHVPFTIERHKDAPFSDNRYFSVAPLETTAHLEMIEEVEKLLS